MTVIEILVAIAGAVGLADLIRVLVDRFFSKKKDRLSDEKSEFDNLKERLKFAEDQYKNIQEDQAKMRGQLVQLYNIIIDLIQSSCCVTNCPNRKLLQLNSNLLVKLKDISTDGQDNENN